jgi:hypothetical protein
MNKLRKRILFSLLIKQSKNICFRCGKEIIEIKDLSIDHKIPWLDSDNPKINFYNLENIAFSHLSCNCSCAKRMKKKKIVHGKSNSYKNGCRCKLCRKATNEYQKIWYKNKKLLSTFTAE